MDACHLLLERPWQFDRHVLHDGGNNTYSFIFSGVKLVLMSSIPAIPSPRRESSILLLQRHDFMGELFEAPCVFLLLAQCELPAATIVSPLQV